METDKIVQEKDEIKKEHIPIFKLEQEILKYPQAECPVFHDFFKGIYARSIVIPSGTILTGAIHKDECFFIVRSGSLILTTETGAIQADSGFMAITKAGTKRAGIALMDTLVTTFHANPEELRTPEEIWDYYTVPAPSNIIEVLEKSQLEA